MTHIYDLDISTSRYEIKISSSGRHGYFKHFERSEESAGELWFGEDNHELREITGVSVLPLEVECAMLARGYWGEILETDKDGEYTGPEDLV